MRPLSIRVSSLEPNTHVDMSGIVGAEGDAMLESGQTIGTYEVGDGPGSDDFATGISSTRGWTGAKSWPKDHSRTAGSVDE
jgi:hypothetical protein